MSPQPEDSPAIQAAEPPPYSPEERAELLRLAHEAIEAALADRKLELNPASPRLLELRGAFTTLHLEGNLRGCVGYVYPVKPLYRTVAETAVAAAFNDTRFPPVTAKELDQLEYEISVLSPFRRLLDLKQIEVGRDGLLMRRGSNEGILLPQVPVEQHWDRKTFLEQASLKAGLSPKAWQDEDTDIFTFSALVFGRH